MVWLYINAGLWSSSKFRFHKRSCFWTKFCGLTNKKAQKINNVLTVTCQWLTFDAPETYPTAKARPETPANASAVPHPRARAAKRLGLSWPSMACMEKSGFFFRAKESEIPNAPIIEPTLNPRTVRRRNLGEISFSLAWMPAFSEAFSLTFSTWRLLVGII